VVGFVAEAGWPLHADEACEWRDGFADKDGLGGRLGWLVDFASPFL
jgi:hypothetical protein